MINKERVIWIIIVLLLSLFIFYMIQYNYSDSLMYKKQLFAKNNENIQYRNKYNQLVSEKLAFIGDKKQLKEEIEYWKKKGDTLTSKLSSKTEQIILLKRKIEIINTGKPTIYKHDTTIMISDVAIDTVILSVDTTDKYHSFKFVGNKNKYAYKIGITDNTELVTEDLGKQGTLVKVINRNPYIVSSEAKSVIVAKKKPSVLAKIVWFVVGGGLGYLVFR